ncbi:hypothetical protein SAMN02745824_0063 [Parasphingorhabdus marina DSM 22363]|uniref:Acetoacetate decarboxylase (ADC) n=1 Tax=Parasphingorhabdus marina DSM 22363 TaxID=1123272 RepID=A0A1N6CM20_9SPHN|nr:hypothetical protein [Parasphingorhabdus marina]SIN59535.1 hypothetical protein SAMN02745824_0063 [Parasphingorhabdus marina DSM 22363]
MPTEHPIFADNPLTGTIDLETGTAPVPYHVYDGEGLLIFGHADHDALTALLEKEGICPVTTMSGDIAAGFIMADFRDASMGPHHELQFFVLVSERPGETIDDAPFALPLAMAGRPDWGTLCVRLWNDRADVIAYNNDYLGLNARMASFGLFDRNEGQVGFRVTAETGDPIIEGRIRESRSTSLKAGWEMLRIAGLREIMRLGRMPYAPGHVVNRISRILPQNRKAQIFTSSDKNIARHWDPSHDCLTISEPEIADLDFRPLAIQNIRPFRFVYRHPDDPV